MRALVTGAGGFIGGHLVETLVMRGHTARALVRDPSQLERVRGLGAEVHVGDVTEPRSLDRALAEVDVVFHTAARMGDWGPWHVFEAVNVRGTQNVLAAAASAGVRRFIHLSSCAVYDTHSSPDGCALDESSPLQREGPSLNTYVRGKLLAEQAVRRVQAGGKLATTILRPAWVYGSRDPNALLKPWRVWFGSHDPRLSLVHVNDLVELALVAASHDGAIGRTYNAACHEEVHLRHFVRRTCAELGVSPPSRELPRSFVVTAVKLSELAFRLLRARRPPPLTTSGLHFFFDDQYIDASRAKRELGWSARLHVEEGLRELVSWARRA
jgi:nucleoside-diphosphate-sugar epimerase